MGKPKEGAPKLYAALIFFGYFFSSRKKSNWGEGATPLNYVMARLTAIWVKIINRKINVLELGFIQPQSRVFMIGVGKKLPRSTLITTPSQSVT